MNEELNECPYCGDRCVGKRDAPCCIESAGGDQVFRMTPKGFLILAAQQEGLSTASAERVWEELSAGCMKLLDGDDEFAALIFDGAGGVVIGANREHT